MSSHPASRAFSYGTCALYRVIKAKKDKGDSARRVMLAYCCIPYFSRLEIQVMERFIEIIYFGNRPQVSMVYLSNRPQVSMVYRLINHAGCCSITEGKFQFL